MGMIPVGTKVMITGTKNDEGWTRGMDKFIGQRGIIGASKMVGIHWMYNLKTARGDEWMKSREGIPYTFIDEWFTEAEQ